MKKEIFALDIGTRKVMGIIAQNGSAGLEIIDMEVIEHESRPMLDGQIHSIEEVSRTVARIKERLEERSGKKFRQVGVAVAGRNLVTYRSKVTRSFDIKGEITTDIVRALELEAVDRIISESRSRISHYYCVGYSPIYYELDGNRITNLVGHSANSIATEVIATFLPKLVLDSMFAVLKKCELEATNITLEPICAINAIIPEEMRNLNIVLVDIGAGTSDLAITKEGMIFSYGMVPEAGDEITERISEILLVDFAIAEKIKRAFGAKHEMAYSDIWGRGKKVVLNELRQSLNPAVRKLAESIAREGLALNAGVPKAVVVVGGGSLTSGLTEELSTAFGLAQDRVGVRLPSNIKNLKDRHKKLSGPEAVTPIGIALMTCESSGLRFIDVEVNNKKIKILDFHQKKDVMGALTLSGIVSEKKIYPRPGMALTITVNGCLKIIKGTLGEPAKITLNGIEVSSLSQKVKDGDSVEFIPALDGLDADICIRDLEEVKPLQVVYNQQIAHLYPKVTMNGKTASLDTKVTDRCEIEVLPLQVRDLLASRGIDTDELSERQILVNINGTPRVLTQCNFTLSVNKSSGELGTELGSNDLVEFSCQSPTFYRIKDVIDIPEVSDKIKVNVDGKDIEVCLDPVQIFMNGHQVKKEEFLIDGAEVKVYRMQKPEILLSDIFRYIDFNPRRALGKKLKILVDDNPAGFTTVLSEGAKVKIVLEERRD